MVIKIEAIYSFPPEVHAITPALVVSYFIFFRLIKVSRLDSVKGPQRGNNSIEILGITTL